MNLSKSTLILLLVGVASASAVPPPAPVNDNRNRSPTQHFSPCDEGAQEARDAVNDIFNNDCTNALATTFQRDVNNNWSKRYGGGWKDRAYNQCAQKTVEQELSRIANRCQTCDLGASEARDAVADIFNDDCNNALARNFQRDVNNNWSRRGGNSWRAKAYNQCAEAAVQHELQLIAEQCENSSQAVDDCNDLGLAAADAIVESSGMCYSASDEAEDEAEGRSEVKRFRRECLKVAIGVCEGNIRTAADNCGADRLSLRTQINLKNKCRGQVFSWTQSATAAVDFDVAAQHDEFSTQAISLASLVTSDADINKSHVNDNKSSDQEDLDNTTLEFLGVGAHVQCNTSRSDVCPRDQLNYVCEGGQNMCCAWSGLPLARNGKKMQRRIDDMIGDIDLPGYGTCQLVITKSNLRGGGVSP